MATGLKAWNERSTNTFVATSAPGVLSVSNGHSHRYSNRPADATTSRLTRDLLLSGSLPQKGIVHYGLAQNRQNPLAGTFNAAVFNTFRRTRNQILYWSIPLIIGYEVMQWAEEK